MSNRFCDKCDAPQECDCICLRADLYEADKTRRAYVNAVNAQAESIERLRRESGANYASYLHYRDVLLPEERAKVAELEARLRIVDGQRITADVHHRLYRDGLLPAYRRRIAELEAELEAIKANPLGYAVDDMFRKLNGAVLIVATEPPRPRLSKCGYRSSGNGRGQRRKWSRDERY